MKPQTTSRVTGFVLPVGSGGVGKTSVSRVLDSIGRGGVSGGNFIHSIRKTKNLEFEYVTTIQTFQSIQYAVTLQFLVPPGQKQSEGDPSGRSFENVIDIYRFAIRRVDVVLFTYDMATRESFDDLAYWVEAVGKLLNDATHFILLGTHMDRVNELEVALEDIEQGMAYLRKEIVVMHPSWEGRCTHLEVSNLTGENLELLLSNLAYCVVSSRLMMP